MTTLRRSPRELVLIGGGVALCVADVASGPDLGNLLVYAVATALFALRFHAARAIAVGACIGALAQQWPHLRYGLAEADMMTLGVFPLLALLLLSSKALVARFDRAPARVSWLPNFWASFTDAQTRALRMSAYCAGALGGLLDHVQQISAHWGADATWPRLAMAGLVVMLALLLLGRAAALLGVWAICLGVLVRLLPEAIAAEQFFWGEPASDLSWLFAGSPHYPLPMVILAAAAVIITTPYIGRLVRRTVLAP